MSAFPKRVGHLSPGFLHSGRQEQDPCGDRQLQEREERAFHRGWTAAGNSPAIRGAQAPNRWIHFSLLSMISSRVRRGLISNTKSVSFGRSGMS